MNSYSEKLMNEIIIKSDEYKDGFFITLNAKTKDLYSFEQQLADIAFWTNDEVYGRQFRKGNKRLFIAGHIQVGGKTQCLHAHFILMHNNDINKDIAELNFFIRRKWYRRIGAKGDIFGGLVDIQKVGDKNGRIGYAFRYAGEDENLNLIYL